MFWLVGKYIWVIVFFQSNLAWLAERVYSLTKVYLCVYDRIWESGQFRAKRKDLPFFKLPPLKGIKSLRLSLYLPLLRRSNVWRSSKASVLHAGAPKRGMKQPILDQVRYPRSSCRISEWLCFFNPTLLDWQTTKWVAELDCNRCFVNSSVCCLARTVRQLEQRVKTMSIWLMSLTIMYLYIVPPSMLCDHWDDRVNSFVVCCLRTERASLV